MSGNGETKLIFLIKDQYRKWLVGKDMVTLATVPDERCQGLKCEDLEAWSEGGGSGGDPKGPGRKDGIER